MSESEYILLKIRREVEHKRISTEIRQKGVEYELVAIAKYLIISLRCEKRITENRGSY